jgi:hypothetical protein
VKHALLASLLTLPLLCGCATDPYGRPDIGERTMGGALLGTAAGALGGAALGGRPIEGAAAGMVLGGALGAATTARTKHRRHYYRDTRGYCYYLDAAGQPKYDLSVRC